MSIRARTLAAILALAWLSTSAVAEDKEDREGGIIGTGIVGTITHLGSIFVNDLRVQVEDDMPVAGSVPPMVVADLRPGHTVAIVAERRADGWHARQVRQVLPLVGQVTGISAQGLTVLGTQVDPGGLSGDLQIGDWVAVSGLWQGQRLLASRIEALEGVDHPARLSGSYLGPNPDGDTVIGGSVLSGIEPSHLQPGDLVRVTGQPTPDGIRADALTTGLFDEAVGLIQVQGYFSRPQASGLYTVLGSGLVAYTDQPEMTNTRTTVIQCGQMGRLGKIEASNFAEPGQETRFLSELSC